MNTPLTFSCDTLNGWVFVPSLTCIFRECIPVPRAVSTDGGSSPYTRVIHVRIIKELYERELTHTPLSRSGHHWKPRGRCVLTADVVSLLISSFKLLVHDSSLVSWGFWLFVPYSNVIPSLFTDVCVLRKQSVTVFLSPSLNLHVSIYLSKYLSLSSSLYK